MAAAIKYEPLLGVPRVTAKGREDVAERIIALAHQSGVTVKEDPDLITILSAVELGDEIPEEIYILVAEILSFVYTLNNDWPDFEDLSDLTDI